MSALHPYQYVALRCVPRPERGEFVNVAVVLYCEESSVLRVATKVNDDRLAALCPDLDLEQVQHALDFVDGVCTPDERAGSAAHAPIGQRFGFLKAPRSTVIQPGPVHGGLTDDPEATLTILAERLLD